MSKLGEKAPKESPTLTGTINMNSTDAIPYADNTKPELNVLQNLKVGTGLAPNRLTVLGNTSLAGNLGVVGATTLDDANSGTLVLQQSRTNKQLNVYGNANITGVLTVAGTDVT